jgi:predicted DCC family thiol-disulfide oxidoreductase YuxK
MECPYIIIFDSECSFCNASVNFIIKRDPKALFCFASMHSDIADSLILEHGLNQLDSDTIILISDGKAYVRAEAVFEIMKYLDGGWSLLRFLRFLPASLNDLLYRFIAKNRYRIFGKRSCMIPSEEMRSRFLTDTV